MVSSLMDSSNDKVKISNVLHVCPSKPSDDFSLPFTFVDLQWFNFHPVERLFFYEYLDLSPTLFFENILPKLQTSLSSTLNHFPPLAGKITWPENSGRPIIQYNKGDSVLLTIAECNDPESFDYLSGDHARETLLFDALVALPSESDTEVSAIALQVTLFPNKGFCIGISYHHAALDDKSLTMFMHAWAHVCKLDKENDDSVILLPEHAPLFNREVIKDPIFINQWAEGMKFYSNRSPKCLAKLELPPGLFRATFRLSKADINCLKDKIMSWQQRLGKEAIHLSTFVVTASYLIVCFLKSAGIQCEKKRVCFELAADYRPRLTPAVPENYGGNCTGLGTVVIFEAKEGMQEDGVAVVAEKISDAIKEFAKTMSEEGPEKLPQKWINKPSGPEIIGLVVAGSSRFEVYGVDYGWGRPKKVELKSRHKDTFVLTENRDDSGGVEICLTKNKQEMDLFATEFHKGLMIAS